MAKSKTTPPAQPAEDAGTKLIEQFDMAKDEPETVEAPAAEPVVEVPAEPVKPKFSKWLTNEAKRAGLADDDLAEMSKEDVLEAIALKTERDREMRAERARDDSGRFVKQEQAPPPPEPEHSLKDLGLDDSRIALLDPEFAKVLTDITKPLAKQIRELKEQLDGVRQRDAHREANAHADRLDQLFLEHTDVFGKGTRHRMDKKSDEYSLRMMVISEMSRLSQSDPSISFDEAFDRASSVVTKFRTPKAETPPAPPVAPPAEKNGHLSQDEINRFKSARTALPANRSTTKPPKSVKAAEEAVGAILSQLVEEQDDELAGLPDN